MSLDLYYRNKILESKEPLTCDHCKTQLKTSIKHILIECKQHREKGLKHNGNPVKLKVIKDTNMKQNINIKPLMKKTIISVEIKYISIKEYKTLFNFVKLFLCKNNFKITI